MKGSASDEFISENMREESKREQNPKGAKSEAVSSG